MEEGLRIEVQKVSGLVKDRAYSVTVIIDNQVQETEKKKGFGTIVWNQLPFTMRAREKSRLVLCLYARRKLDAFGVAAPKLLGDCEVQLPVGEEPITIRINSKVPEGSAAEITFKVSRDTDDAQRSDLKKAAEQANASASAAITADNSLPVLVDRVKSFVDMVDSMVEVHPYAKLAWQVITAGYEVIKAQAERDAKIQGLISKMNDAYEFVEEARALRSHKALLETLSQQTIECCMFIQRYTADVKFVSRAVKNLLTTADDAINEYTGKFDEIMEKFRNHSSLHIELATVAMARDISELGDEINFQDMPYAKGARFESGKQCLAGTRVKILDDIADWALNSKDGSRLCLLAGPAGIGKSAIAHSIAKRFDKMKRLGSSFCFDRSDIANRRPDTLFPTIARDLADYDPSFKKALGVIVRNHTSLRNTRDIDDQFENLISQPACSFSVPGPVLVVIDALDESGHASKLLSVLLRRMESLPPDLKLFVTARDEGTIVQRALASEFTFRPGDPSNLQGKSASQDVLLYVNAQLLDGDEGPIPGIEDSHCKALVEQSEGLFQWASVACSVIAGVGSRIGTTPMERYRDVISAGSSLDGLYTRILSRLIDFDDPRSVKRFKALMGIALTTYEPLNMNTLRVLWRHSEEDSEDPDGQFNSVLKYMGSLLSGVTDETAPVRPLHTTFREYLTDPKRSGKLYVNTEASHNQLASGSLSVMISQLSFNICRLDNSYLRNSDVEDLEGRVKKYIGDPLSYSCRFWDGHLENIRSFEPRMQARVVDLLMNKALYWLEVLSFVGGVNRVHHLRTSLSTYIEVTKTEDAFVRLILDMESFTRMFNTLITTSACHIYISALPFVPPLSTLSQRYEPQFHNLPTIASGRAESWPMIEETFIGHSKAIRALAFSPKRAVFASGSSDQTVKLWDSETNQVLQTLHSEHGSVFAVAFSSDGKLLAAGMDKGFVQLWDISGDEAQPTLAVNHGEKISALCFSPDATTVVSGSKAGCLMVWSVQTGELLGEKLESHEDEILCVAFSPDGKHFASGSRDGSVQIWDSSTCQVSIKLKPEFDQGGMTSVSYSPSSSHLFSITDTGRVHVWDTSTGKVVAKMLGEETYTVHSSSFSQTCDRVVTCSQGGIIDLWAIPGNYMEEKPSAQINRRPANEISCVALSPDTSKLICGAWDGSIHVLHVGLNPDTWPEPEDVPIEGDITGLAFSPDGEYLASLNEAEDFTFAVQIFNTDSGELVYGPFDCEEGAESAAVQSSALSFSMDGDRLAALAFCCVHVWDLADGEGELIWEDHTTTCVCLAFSPVHNDYLVLAFDDGSIKVWDIEEDDAVVLCSSSITSGAKLAINDLVFSQDGGYLFAGGNLRGDRMAGRIQMFNSHSGESIRGFDYPSIGVVTSMSLLADDTQLAVGFGDTGEIHIMEIESGKRVYSIKNEDETRTTDVVSSPSSNLISGGFSGKIQQWDLQTQNVTRTVYKGRSVSRIALSRDGQQLGSGTADGSLRIWDIMPTSSFNPSLPQLRSFSSKAEHAVEFDLAGTTGAEQLLQFDPKTGWITGTKGELILWIPPDHRSGLWLPGMKALCGRETTEIDMSRYAHGSNWATCLDTSS